MGSLCSPFATAANELPELQVEPGFLPKLKERVRIAREIEKAQHAVKKSKHEKSWLQETAEAMDIDIDPDMMYVPLLPKSDTIPHHPSYNRSAEESDDEVARSRKAPKQRLRDNAPRLRHELDELLRQPLMARGVSAKYPTSGSRVVIDDLLADKSESIRRGLRRHSLIN
jgi:ATP-dependent RNA helicase DDX24/MAK5